MHLVPGLIVADRFRLVRQLGQGGMGSIWLAQHTRLDVPCAVKFILGDAAASAEIRGRFEREARAAAQLRSAHVVQILDHGVSEHGPYIAMELLEGEDLAHRVKRCGVLPPREVGVIATQVGRALQKAHAAGLVHRDLKPANIFLARDDDREIAKVLDFGVAKETSLGADSNTKTGSLLGTPYYMSPEQARGNKDVDHRSDLWALAVVVFQCLTGRLPFQSDALGDLFVQIIIDPLPVPSAVGRVPAGFDAWWLRAAARDPALRFQTAKELTDSLARVLDVPESLELGVSTSPGARAAAPFQSGTIALTPAPSHGSSSPGTPSPGTPPPGWQTPSSAGPPTPFHSAVSVAASPPTPMPQPPKKRGLAIAGALGAFALGAVGVLVFLPRGSSQPAPTPAPAAEVPPEVSAKPAPLVVASASATPIAPPPLPASSASVVASVVAPPAAATAPPPARPKPAKQSPAPAPKSNTPDFGI